MSNDRDEVLEALAEGRAAAEEIGLRRYRAFIRRRTWYAGSGALPWATSAPGRGLPSDVEVAITPSPKVDDVDVRLIASSGGTFQTGDLWLRKITPRREPNIGLELWQLREPPASTAEERHIVLVGRSGTPWHVYEGTARLLTPGPYDLPTALACANALQAAMVAHLPNAEAHLTPDAMVPGPAAVDLTTALALANALRAVWVAHRASLVVHPAADPYPVAAPVATTAESLAILLHGLLRAFNGHVAEGPVSECTVVHAGASKAFSHELIVRPTRRTP